MPPYGLPIDLVHDWQRVVASVDHSMKIKFFFSLGIVWSINFHQAQRDSTIEVMVFWRSNCAWVPLKLDLGGRYNRYLPTYLGT